MNSKEIFEKGKNLAVQKGKHEMRSDYIGPSSVGGDFSIYGDSYVFGKNGLKIKYFKGSFDDDSGKWELLEVHHRESLFRRKKKVYSFHSDRKGRVKEFVSPTGDWQGKLEKFSIEN